MSLLPDPAEIEAIADRIAAHAVAARARADILGRTIAGTNWHGFAADTFAAAAEAVLGGLRSSAQRLDAAADTLRRHAGNVRRMLDLLSRLSHDTLGLGIGIDRTLYDGVFHPGHMLGDITGVFGDATEVLGDLGDLIGIG